jgi:hypothetical protein
MAGKTQRIVLGMSVALLGVGGWWLTSTPDDGDQEASNDAASVRDGARNGRTGLDNADRGEGGLKGLAALNSDKGRAPKFRKPDREGMEALTGVLGGGFGFDGEGVPRDEEAFPRPETVEEAREMFTDARTAIETELMGEGPMSEERKRELRQRSNLALTDLQDQLDLDTPEGKAELNEARHSTRSSMIDLGPLKLEHREGAGGRGGAAPQEG